MRLILIMLFMSSDIVFAAQGLCTTSDLTGMAKITAIIVAIMAVLRPISAGLGKVAEKTEATWDNSLAKMLAKSISYMGWFVGLFNIGDVPASVKHRPLSK